MQRLKSAGKTVIRVLKIEIFCDNHESFPAFGVFVDSDLPRTSHFACGN